MGQKINILPIKNKADFVKFLKVTDLVYNKSDKWCKPLNIEKKMAFSGVL